MPFALRRRVTDIYSTSRGILLCMSLAGGFEVKEVDLVPRSSGAPGGAAPENWKRGWVALDGGYAVAVVTANRDQDPDTDRPDAIIGLVYVASEYRRLGLGKELVAFAQAKLAESKPPVTLYKTGTATPGGAAVCSALEVHRRYLPRRSPRSTEPWAEDEAELKGRQELEEAAQRLGIPVVAMP